jgi:hypothetical protein
METRRKFLVVFFLAIGILFMFDAVAGCIVLNFVIHLVVAHAFVGNIVIDFLIGFALSLFGSLFWLGAE